MFFFTHSKARILVPDNNDDNKSIQYTHDHALFEQNSTNAICTPSQVAVDFETPSGGTTTIHVAQADAITRVMMPGFDTGLGVLEKAGLLGACSEDVVDVEKACV